MGKGFSSAFTVRSEADANYRTLHLDLCLHLRADVQVSKDLAYISDWSIGL